MNTEEIIIKKFHPDPFYFLSFYFSGFVIIVLGFVLILFFSWLIFASLLTAGLLIFILAKVSRRAETFYLLDGGIAREYRLFSTSREFAEYEKIQNIKINQSFVENIFDIGNLKFDTAGGDKTEVNFRGVKNPYEIESTVREKMK